MEDLVDPASDPAGPVPPRFTVLLPVHRPPAMLPYAIEAVLAQTCADFELFIVCDGAPEETLAFVHGVAARDSRVKVFAFPKGPFCGEAYRHIALMEARGRYVAHIADDDLWFPNHLEELEKLLRKVDFGHLIHVHVKPAGGFEVLAGDLTDARLRGRMLREDYNVLGDTVTGYRLAAYRRLPEGWATPPRMPYPDLQMWRKFLRQDTFTFGTRMVVTALIFASEERRHMSIVERAEEVCHWYTRLLMPEERNEIVQEVWRSLVLDVLQQEGDRAARLAVIHRLQAQIQHIEALLDHHLPAARPIDFSEHGNSPLYVGTGWSYQEPGFRWTDGNDAVLRIRLDPRRGGDPRQKALFMRLHASAFGGTQRVAVSIDGERVADLVVNADWRDHDIGFSSLLDGSEHEITFHLPDAHSPRSRGTGDDPRELGIAVSRVTILPDPSASV